ncbi:NAD-P-binding protein [Clavulina sp. PMI_390]|nr:NAD-P-binding protein [Clavulina sp. PMI_390]
MVDLKIPSLFGVQGQVALITGGGSGIGLMIATALVQNGAKVYIASRKEKQLKEAADVLNAKGPGSCHYIVANLGSRAACEDLATRFAAQESKLHILVNNSGSTWGGKWEDFPEKEGWDRVMNLNVKSIFYLTAALTPLLVKDANNRTPSRVINISSVASWETRAEGSSLAGAGDGLYSYNVSKAAVNHLTQIQAVTLGPKHVNVNAILPGVFPSKMTAFGIKQAGEQMANAQPSGRYGMPEDMGGTALFLCSPASAHITGALIPIDGGATIAGAGTKL